MLKLTTQPTQPVRRESGAAEFERIWESLDQEGRRLLLANARALIEVTGRGRRPEPRI